MQKWQGGQFLSPKPASVAVVTNINEFWVAADEIEITNTLNATIRVSGTVVLVANKITVQHGAQINWTPPDPFSEVTFDWKMTTPGGIVDMRLKVGEQVEIGNDNQQLSTKGPRGELGTLWMKFERHDKRSANQKIDLTNLERNLIPWSNLSKQIV